MPLVSLRRQLSSLSVSLVLMAAATSPCVAAPLYQSGSYGYHVERFVNSIVLAHIDNDGYLDMAVASGYSANRVTLLRGQADGTFVAMDTLLVTYVDAIAIADFNQDGDPDLVAHSLNTVSVWLGNSDFTFGMPQDHSISAVGGSWGEGVAVGTLTGDALPDVVAPDSADALVVWQGTGGGALTAIQRLPGVGDVSRVQLADLDVDGDLDLVAEKLYSGNPNIQYAVSVFLNDGFGTFTTSDECLGDASYGMDVGDLNGDGDPDILLGGNCFAGSGDGQFGLAQSFGTEERHPRLADLNQDGYLDVVTGALTPDLIAPAGAQARVRLGLGGGVLGPVTLWPSCRTPVDFDFADLNGDGSLDMVAAGGLHSTIAIHLGNGSGGFPPLRSFDAGGSVSHVAIGDLSEDGTPEVLALSPNVSLLRVLRGLGGGALGSPGDHATPASAVALAASDLDADGHLDVVVAAASVSVFPGNGAAGLGSRVDYPNAAPPGKLAVGDVTGDGVPDVVTASNNPSGAIVSVHPGQMGAGLGPRLDYTTGSGEFYPRSVQIGEVTGDARPDVVVVTHLTGPTVAWVFPGQADGSLGAPIITSLGNVPDTTPVKDADLADSDFDGLLDLNVVWGTSGGSARLRRFLGVGNGTFGSGVNTIVGKDGFQVVFADVTGDGRSDLLIAEYWANGVGVCEARPNGSFADPMYFSTRAYTVNLAVGDLNGDALPDIVTADYASQTVTVLLRTNGEAVGVPATDVTPPAGLSIALAWPTLARGDVRLAFTLPERGETSVELFDLEGRRLRKQNLGVLEAGANERAIRMDPGMPPGVVWLRLRQGGASAAAKVVVAR